MLTDASLRDLLRAGYETSDSDYVGHTIQHLSRTVYFIAQFLAEEPQYRYLDSRELQRRLDAQLWTVNSTPGKRFNPVDWFSQQWTQASRGEETQYFAEEYLELFDREGTNPTSYRIKPALHESVVRILTELAKSTRPASSIPLDIPQVEAPHTPATRAVVSVLPGIIAPREIEPDLPGIAEQLNKEGVFDPTSLEDARVRALRAVVVREGQPQFRAALLAAYGGRCAITECDATPALEAAHVKPYEGVITNVVNNGILLRADIHTLFDLDLIGIDPIEMLVQISIQLENTVYRHLEGTHLRGPDDHSATPNREALDWRWKRFLGERYEYHRNCK